MNGIGKSMDKQKFDRDLICDYLARVRFDKEIRLFYRNRKVLVTGGAGAIGRNLVSVLSELVGPDGRVIVLDNLSAIKGDSPWNLVSAQNILFILGDIRRDADVKRAFREKPDLVFHLAAFFANQNSIDYPEVAASVDVQGLIKVLDLSVFCGVDRFVYASSGCAIYGSYPDLPVREEFISMNMTSPYQINKMAGEMYCNFYKHNYDLNTVNCRFFNSFGPGEVPGQYRNVIPNFIYWALAGKPLPISGDGNATRDFTYVLDLVQGLILAGHHAGGVGNNFNLASSRETRIQELADMINKLVNNTAGTVQVGRRQWDTKDRMWASTEKASETLGYSPIIRLEEGLERTIEWFRYCSDEISLSVDFPPGMSAALKD